MTRKATVQKTRRVKENSVKFRKVTVIGNNQCSICGTHFDDDICSHGHQLGTQVSVLKN